MVIINRASHKENLYNMIIRINQINGHCVHVRSVPCHHGMERPQVADGGDALQVWRAAANILNKQLRTAEKGFL
jgi:hypothetical protein